MIENVEKTIEWLEINDTPYFTVQTKEGANSKVFETREDESFEDAKNRFRKTMELTSGNRFYIKARRLEKDNRGGFADEFRNNLSNTEIPSINGTGASMPGVGVIAISELDRRLTEERQRILQDVRIERLEAENKELRDNVKSRDDVAHRFYEKLNPYIGTILGGVFSKLVPNNPTIALAGIEEPNETVDNNERLEAALIRFANAEPDFIRIIEKLAKMAEDQDETYLMAKKMLLNP